MVLMTDTIKKIRWSTMLYGCAALLVLVVAMSLIVTYFVPRTSHLVQSFVNRVPYPAVVVGYRGMFSFHELSQNVQSVKRFYENQDFSKVGLRVDFTTEDGQKRLKVREKEILNKMIEDEAIVVLAKKRDIFVSPETARQGVARKLEEYGDSKTVEGNLDRLYGWKMADFEEKVVLPSLYQEKLNEAFLKEVDPVTKAKKRIEEAAEALRNGEAFESVVKQYSEGQTADKGGDLGWFSIEDLAPELRNPVVAQKVGAPGSVIESSLGFHIVLVQEVKKEKSAQLYRIKQIFARKNTFADWLSDQMKTLSIKVLDLDYQWNNTSARAEFRKAEWRQYEEELLKKTGGDAAFSF